ncbi:MAG TPA: tetratricopeptide repeat protein [Tenuifilaceae bacterium]|nr:tetratricopeptide repeat protein [Tenuifilaceae bacterium]HPE18832.1 tetratricopeptide repeat protein [Tenuifilaceae bacterium]HPJ46282.1 tetratricopeptide repeat protein [Tenuifilaceae bacterium]HPQ34656.1 tetratricopeptide repeat protein [Tenuifilaceae bacterium]HRX68096.1 tetratricopeptide repeat protein [Tenuifilaceae bacterium]
MKGTRFKLTILAICLVLFPFYILANKSLNLEHIESDSIDFSIDSLEHIITRTYDLYYIYDLSLSVSYAEKAMKSFERQGILDAVVQMLYVQGNLYRFDNQHDKALNFFLLALDNYRTLNNKKGESATLNQIGSIYRLQGNYPGALEYFFSSLKIANETQDSLSIASVLNSIGIVYFYQKNYDKALDYYKQSLNYELLKNDEYGISVSYINIGEVYQHKGDLKQALDYYLRALILAKKHQEKDEDKDGVGILYNEIGSIYSQLSDINLGSTYLNKALQIFSEIDNKQRLAECYVNLGKLEKNTKHFNKAIKHFNKSLDYAISINALDLVAESNRLLSEIYEQQGNQTKAYSHYKKYIQTRDSLFNEDNTKKSVQAEMLYHFEKQIHESKLEQARKDAMAKEFVRRQRLMQNLMAIIVLMLIVVVAVVYNAFKSKQKVNEKLRMQQDEIVEKNEELLQQQEEILAQRDEIENKNHYLEQTQKIIEAKNDRIISSIEYAQTIQEAILPNEEQLTQYFPDHMVIFLPKDIVSGDFYWFSSIDNLLYAAVIDCTGHGVPGSFMSLIGNTMLNQIINEWQTRDPGLILELMHLQVRKALKQDNTNSKAHASMDICLVTIDPQKGVGTFAGASRPLYLFQNNTYKKISGDCRSVGGYQRESKRYFTNFDFDITKPTTIYLTTDGFADQMNSNVRKYGTRRLIKLLQDIHNEPMAKQKEILLTEYHNHKKDAEQIDDICILGLKV